MPVKWAGILRLPPISVPRPRIDPPPAISAASPPEDPPGVLLWSWGLRVLPYTGLLQLQETMVWGMLVRQKGTACCSFIPTTKLLSLVAGRSMSWARPMVLS